MAIWLMTYSFWLLVYVRFQLVIYNDIVFLADVRVLVVYTRDVFVPLELKTRQW